MIKINKYKMALRVLDTTGDFIFLFESEYDQFVTDLEAKARELWPDHFAPAVIVSAFNDHDGNVVILDERMQQIPINSRGKK